jgi:hypothetical protein
MWESPSKRNYNEELKASEEWFEQDLTGPLDLAHIRISDLISMR